MQPLLHISRQLPAPADCVWQLITDTHRWPDWGPSIRRVHCKQRFIRAGSRGRIQTALGLWLPFAVDRFDPGRYWDWRVCGVAATGHRLDSAGPGRCTLSFTVPFWAFGYGLVCRLALMRIHRLVAQPPMEA
jgi:hypothetical protein